jgi:hypothetical protein
LVERSSPPDFILINGREEVLETSLRPGQTHQRAETGVERLCASRDVRIASRDAELVIRSCFVQTDEVDSSIGIQVNKASVGRAGPCPSTNMIPLRTGLLKW